MNRIRGQLARLLPLYVVVFMGFIGYSLMITVFTPMLLRSDRSMLPQQSSISSRTMILGLVLCLYPLGQFIGSPVMGSLSDRFGRRPVLLSSLLVTTICYGLISLSISRNNLPLLMTASWIAGLAEANVVTAQSAIADLVSSAERNRYFGYVYMAVSLAYVVGPLGGGKLTDPHLVKWFGDATPFWVVFGLLILTTVGTMMVFRETRAPGPKQIAGLGETIGGLVAVFGDSRLRRFYGVNLLLYLAIFGFFRSYPMYLVDEFKLDISGTSEFVAWVGVPIVLTNLWLTGFLSARIAIRTMTICSAAATGVMMIAVVLPDRQGALWPILFLAGASLGVCLPSCATLLSNAANAADQGRVMGANQAIQVGAEALSGLVAGLLAAVIVKLPLIVLGALSVIAATFLVLLV